MGLASCSLEVAHAFMLLEPSNSAETSLEHHGGGKLARGGGWRRGGVSAQEGGGEERMGRGRREQVHSSSLL